MAGQGCFVPGVVKATYGTGSSLMTLLPELPQATGRSKLATTIAWGVADAGVQYALEGNVSMAGSAVQWVGEFLGLPDSVKDTAELAASVENSDGIFFVPAMVGLGAPHWDNRARGTIAGLGRTTRAAHLAHAAIESIAFQVRDVFDAMLEELDSELPVLRADGGATRNDWLMQFQADILGRPVVRSSHEDLSALGAARLGGLTLGWWRSLADLAGIAVGDQDVCATAAIGRAGRTLPGLETRGASGTPSGGATVTAMRQGDSHRIVLEALGMTKLYGAQIALKDVTFRVRRGAVNVLIGENGAGKSTLMRLLAGAEQASAGQIVMDGRVLHLRSPRDAAAAGIEIVHQELSVLDNLNVAENIFAGRELVRAGILVDRANEEERSGLALANIGMPMDVHAMHLFADELSLGCRQLVELARSLAHRAKVLILDEPTSALSSAEASVLFRVIEDLKSRGVAIIYISHRLHELLHLGDYFTVLRDGCVVDEGERGKVDRTWIVERMSGRSPGTAVSTRVRTRSTEATLEVAELCSRQAGRPVVNGVSFSVGKGEVVGIYGLLGSGRTELMESLAGLRKPESGTVKVCDKCVSLDSVATAIRAGITLAPGGQAEGRSRPGPVNPRKHQPCFAHGHFSRHGFRREATEAARAKEARHRCRFRPLRSGASCYDAEWRQPAKGSAGPVPYAAPVGPAAG
jgi:ABC-type sugar transport system ATPase subunit